MSGTITPDAPQPLTWDELDVGLTVGPIDHLISQEMVVSYRNLLAADEARPAETGPGSAMPPTLLATDYVLLLHHQLQLGFGLMTRHETHALHPVTIGDRVSVSGTITDKFERKDRHYWTMRYEVRNEVGVLCIVYIVTCTVD